MKQQNPTQPVPEFDRESADKCQMLDLMSAERFGAQRLLEKVHELFPLAKAGMPAEFKGTHSMTLNAQGELVINIWWQGLCWPVKFHGSLQPPIRTTLPPDFPPVEQFLGQGKP